MSCYRYMERIEWEKLLELALEQNLFICNSKFRYKAWGQSGPGQVPTETTQIWSTWHLLTRDGTQQWDCRSFQCADIASNDSLVLCNIKLRLTRFTKRQEHECREINALKIETICNKYREAIKKGLEKRDSNLLKHRRRSTEASRVKESTPLQEHKKRKWISEQTLELAKDKRPLKLRAQDPETKQKCRLQPTKQHQQERTRKNG